MSKSSCMRAALAGGAVVVLAGCGASASSSGAAAGSTSSAAPSTATSSPRPNAADLASGKAFHSVLRVRVSGTGGNQYENADVTVQGTGTVTVTVPAGTYRATAVTMTMTENVGSYHSTQVVETWEAAGTGPVKTEVLIRAGGRRELTSTEELLSFTRG